MEEVREWYSRLLDPGNVHLSEQCGASDNERHEHEDALNGRACWRDYETIRDDPKLSSDQTAFNYRLPTRRKVRANRHVADRKADPRGCIFARVEERPPCRRVTGSICSAGRLGGSSLQPARKFLDSGNHSGNPFRGSKWGTTFCVTSRLFPGGSESSK